jgi:CheY-like chemotaxis protein
MSQDAEFPPRPRTGSAPASGGPPGGARTASGLRRAHLPLQGLRVLVCDDDDDARELLVEVLSPAGAIVTVAASVREALEKFASERPHVIVSDIGLPIEDGYSFLRRIRALSLEDGGLTPAIALTAYAAAKDVRAAHEAGFQHHMVKPVEPRDLIARVAALGSRDDD